MVNDPTSTFDPELSPEEVKKIDIELGKKLRVLRVQAGLTQSDIADFLEISPQQYQKYEKGASRCSISSVYRLADYFQVSVSALLPQMGQNSPGFSEAPAAFPDDHSAKEITDEAEALAQLLSIFVRIHSKPLRQKILRLLNDTIDPS